MADVNCLKCEKIVTNRHSSATMCEVCQRWIHRTCFNNKQEYETVKADVFWICSDACQEFLSVKKQTLCVDPSISDPSSKALFGLMRGVIFSNARNSYQNKRNFEHFNKRIIKLEENLNTLNTIYKAKIKDIAENCNKKIEEMKNEVSELKQINLNNKAICIGLTYSINNKQNSLQAIESYALEHKIEDLDIQSISNCYQIKSDKLSKTIIEFVNSDKKHLFLQCIKKIRREKKSKSIIMAYEMVTHEVRQLLEEARLEIGNLFKFIWTKNGKVFVRKEKLKTDQKNMNPAVRIKNSKDIFDLKEKNQQIIPQGMDTEDIPEPEPLVELG